MGLIKAAAGASLSVLSETWKDFFVCDAMGNEILMCKGIKKGGNSRNEIITNGSGVVVNEGQCALIVEDGNILEVAAEPGKYTFDSSASPSIFDGGMEGLKGVFKDVVGRFTYGGEVNRSQRVYYINTKEILNNRYTPGHPIPFSVVFDKRTGSEVEVGLMITGEYSFKINRPLIFFSKVAGNVQDVFRKIDLQKIMNSEITDYLLPELGNLSAKAVRYSDIPSHTDEIREAIDTKLDELWETSRGIKLESFAITSVSINEEDARKIRDIQLASVNRDTDMANATIVTAMADALRDAANNANGAAAGFLNINMAQQAGGSLLRPTNNTKICQHCGASVPADSKFCPQCGNKL